MDARLLFWMATLSQIGVICSGTYTSLQSGLYVFGGIVAHFIYIKIQIVQAWGTYFISSCCILTPLGAKIQFHQLVDTHCGHWPIISGGIYGIYFKLFRTTLQYGFIDAKLNPTNMYLNSLRLEIQPTLQRMQIEIILKID